MLHRDFEEILGSEIISITGGLVAGLMMTYVTNKLEMVPALLILLPGFLEMRGNISGTLSARLSAGLHVGALTRRYNRKSIINGNILASVFLAILLSIFLGLAAYFISYEFFDIVNTNIIFVALIAGIISTVIEVPISTLTTLWLYRHGHDPNNIMGPYITTIGDIVSILSLLIAVSMV